MFKLPYLQEALFYLLAVTGVLPKMHHYDTELGILTPAILPEMKIAVVIPEDVREV
jgi:hypothetical protein